MNNQGKYEEDPLKKYINPEKIEMAPKGFTSKVMTRIQLENAYDKVSRRSAKKNLVPVISVAVTLILLAAAFVIPGNQTDSVTPAVLKLINNIKPLLPELSFSSIFRLTLPSVMMYVLIGILVLTIFDRALNGLFHREK
jgi:multisubunit Na+/H+ antiporter MnhB subunit